MRNEYKYSAFISHSGNLDDALKLQRKIARYSLPLYLRDKNKSFFKRVLFPERLKKCVLDATDFSANKLSSEIKGYIEESKDIIVICSHNTGNPPKDKHDWVSDEIRYYLELERGRSPIPFIVEGEPYTNDENECFPLALREIKDKDIYSNSEGLGANLKKDGWWKATIRVIAGLLDLPFDDLWQREKRRRRRRILFVSLFVLCLLSLAFAGYRQLLKSEYARKAREIVENIEKTGDYYTAKQDALKISPSKWKLLRPLVPEAEEALRIAMSRNDLWLRYAPDAFTPDGKHLVRTTNDSIVFVNLVSGKTEKAICFTAASYPKNTVVKNIQMKRGVGSHVGGMHLHPDGEHIIWKDNDVVKIGNMTNVSDIDSFVVVGNNEVISQDCRYLLTTEFCKDNYKVHLYDISKKCEVSRLDNENYSSAIFDANNTHVALMNKQAQVLKCYRVEDLKLEGTFQVPYNTTDNFSFSPDGTKILCRASHSLLLNLENGSVKQLPSHFQNTAFHPTDNYIVSVHENSIVFYDTLANLIDSISLCYKLIPYNYKISSDGRYLLSSHNVVELKHIHVDKVKGCLVKTNQKNNCFYTLSDSVLYKYDMTMMRVVDSLCLSNTVLLCQWKVFGAKVTQMDHTLIDVSCHDEYVATVRDNVMYLWNFGTKRCESTIELAAVEKLEFDKNQDNVLYVFQSEMNGISIPKTRITKLNINGNVIKKENSCPLRYGSIRNGIHNHVGIIDEARYFTTFNDTLLIVDPLKTDSQKMSGVKLICTGNDINNCWISNNKMFVYGNDAILRLYDVNSFKEEQAYQLGNFIYTPQYNISRKLILFKDLGNINKGLELSSLRVIDTKTSYNYTINKLIEHVPVTNFMFTPDEQHIVYSDHEYTYIIDFQDDRKLVERAVAICK